MRPQDQALYRRLRQICGERATRRRGRGFSGPTRSGRSRARAARAAAPAAAATGSARTETVSATLRETDVLAVVGGDDDLVVAWSSRASRRGPGCRPGLLEVVQKLLGLVLEPQHVDRRRPARRRPAARPARGRPRRAGGRAGRSWRRRSRPASAPRAPATSRARAARPPRGPRPTGCRGRRSGSARSGGGGGRSPGRARGPPAVKASDLSARRST